MDKSIDNKKHIARTRRTKKNRYVSRTSREKKDNPRQNFTFDIKVISIQQFIIALIIFLAFLITNLLPMENSKEYVSRINMYISQDAEINQVYNNFNDYVNRINNSIGFLKKVE